MSQIRGLVNFIGDIRNCKTEEEERTRIDKELAKIRSSFSNRNVQSYAKKKYMWKIMYMYTLGYTVEFGHMQCVELISSDKFSEKNVGYVGVSLLLIEHNEMLRMCISTIQVDLQSRNEIFQSLALTCVANVGGSEFAENLVPDVQALLISGTSRNFVRKKSALCLLRLLRQYPENCPSPQIAQQIIKLAEHRNVGVVTSVLSLLTGLATYDSESYGDIVPVAIRLLHQFVINRECSKEYIYYRTPCPWLQVKLLRILQYYPPPKDKNMLNKLHDILDRVVTKTEVTQSVNKNHADHSILFEAMNVIIHLNLHGEDMLHDRAIHKLLHFINVKEGNIRYLGLDAMARLAKIANTHKLIKRHLRTIQYSLDDSDISIRKRALDLLYSICDEDNVVEIIDHLLRYLNKAEYAIREEMVLKIAILAEKYATDHKWYIDVILKLLTVAGDYVSEDVWHRVVQIVTNHEELQAYAAEKVFVLLQSPPIHESMIKVAGYVLGEFGHLIEQSKASGAEQFDTLYKHFQSCAADTKALLLSTFMKFVNMYDDLGDKIMAVFKSHHSAIDPEIQQRAIEYSIMAQYDDQDLITQVWEAMPDFPERDSPLIKIINKQEVEVVATVTNKVFSGAFSDDDGNNDKGDDDDDDDSADEEDEDDDEEEEEEEEAVAKPSQPTPQQPPAAAAAPQEADLLSSLFGDDMSGSAIGGGGGGAGNAVILTQDRQKLLKLLLQPAGVLFENDAVQIGVRSQVEIPGGLLKVMLYYGNKGAAPIKVQSIQCTNAASLSGLQISFAPTAFEISPKQQVQQQCKVQLNAPIAELPAIEVVFSNNSRLQCKFPVVASKFFKPHVFEPQQFKQRWVQLKNEQQQILQISHDYDANKMRGILSNGMNMGLIAGVDQNPNNSIGCAVYHFAKKKDDNNFVTMPVLMRLEFNAQNHAIRVTVRSPHQSTTASVMAACVAIFQQ
eukprot:CAMPEP_0202695802 /NCGR_PEP_ID=MMETSP1385-20130828/9289_1 /ASSEMBLY_ACC=CAM_ASM_000861 /TAXON_ID=933848 /ORGANISM="Elphidium margaritaceum" /LENGTH=955 /DNA_ID=CAMNT_0049351879 /DNA_START=71 /DNA_END=2938 /DNA_ORIENTATION=-